MHDDQARIIIRLLGSIRNILLLGFTALAVLMGISVLRSL
jgi:hypothetical protein